VSGAIALPQEVDPATAKEGRAGRPRSGPAVPTPESLSDVGLQARRGELMKAEAQRDLAIAKLARIRRLERVVGGIDPGEAQAAEAEVKIATAERDIKAAGVREAEILATEARGRRGGAPEAGTSVASDRIGSLETRLREVERKLDLILERLGEPGPKPPAADPGR